MLKEILQTKETGIRGKLRTTERTEMVNIRINMPDWFSLFLQCVLVLKVKNKTYSGFIYTA